jgi:hypothetical protein
MIPNASKENNAAILKGLEMGEESKGREHITERCGLYPRRSEFSLIN